MIGGGLADLIFVSVIALGVITMLVIQAAQRGRTRAEILRAVAFVWGAVASHWPSHGCSRTDGRPDRRR